MATLGSPYDRQGSWTPTLTFATPGDLSVTYSTRQGLYLKIGRLVRAWFTVGTSAFTHTTASGNVLITGLTFAAASGINFRGGAVTWAGITKATYTQVSPIVDAATAVIRFDASGSGVLQSAVTAADMPTGGTIALAGSVTYIAANT